MGREGNNTPQNADASLLLNQLGFTRSGHYYYSDGNLRNQSSNGNYWSHTPYGQSYAYNLYFYSTCLYPRINGARDYGFSLRCLAR